MRNILPIFLVFFFVGKIAFSQSAVLHPMQLVFSKLPSEKELLGKINDIFPDIESKATALKLEFTKTSPGGKHYHFLQTYKGIPIVDAYLRANLTEQNVLHFCVSNFSTFKNGPEQFESIGLAAVTAKLTSAYETEDPSTYNFSVKEVWFEQDQKLHPAYLIETNNFIKSEYWEICLDAKTLNEFFRRDRSMYFQAPPPPDTVRAKVFFPDPVTQGLTTYGFDYIDNNDLDSPFLNAWRITVILPDLVRVGGIFSLDGPYAKIVNFESPNTPTTTSTDGNFFFTRSQDSFEDVNAYFHVDSFQRYVQSLDFDSLYNSPINIDAHGLNGADNSKFVPNGTASFLSFGEGGVDDAEDGDVIVHEYTHGLSYSGSPGSNSGTERQGLDEGIGDYMAASFSKAISPHNWFNVFSWDGHNPFWAGRRANATMSYQTVNINDIYEIGMLWASTMMEIQGVLGRTIVDRVQLQELYYNTSNNNLNMAAHQTIYSDSVLYGGVHTNVFQQYFCNRGIFQGQECVVAKDHELSGLDFGIWPNPSSGQVTLRGQKGWIIRILDLQGREISRFSMESGEMKVELKPGFFVLEAQNEAGLKQSQKLVVR